MSKNNDTRPEEFTKNFIKIFGLHCVDEIYRKFYFFLSRELMLLQQQCTVKILHLGLLLVRLLLSLLHNKKKKKRTRGNSTPRPHAATSSYPVGDYETRRVIVNTILIALQVGLILLLLGNLPVIAGVVLADLVGRVPVYIQHGLASHQPVSIIQVHARLPIVGFHPLQTRTTFFLFFFFFMYIKKLLVSHFPRILEGGRGLLF